MIYYNHFYSIFLDSNPFEIRSNSIIFLIIYYLLLRFHYFISSSDFFVNQYYA